MTPSANPQTQSGSAERLEVDRLYEALFARPAPDVIALRFQGASKQLENRYTAAEVDMYRRCLSHDLEALEFAGRCTRRLPLLTEKIRLVVYLAENLPENQPVFVNDRDRFLRAIWSVAAGAVRSAYKLCKGLVIMRKVARA